MSEAIEKLKAILREKLLDDEAKMILSELTIASGKCSVSIGGDATESVIVTGSNNIVGDNNHVINQNTDPETIRQIFVEILSSHEISPIELKEAVCNFLEQVEDKFKKLKFFHSEETFEFKLENQYVPIQVTLDRRYKKHSEDFRSYAESEEEIKRLYATKGDSEEFERSQINWQEAKKEYQKIMVLADPGMGKSTLLRMEAYNKAKEEKNKLGNLLISDAKAEDIKKGIDDVILPIYLKLSDLAKEQGTLIEIISKLIGIYYPRTSTKIDKLIREKLKKGQCLLLLDAWDEVPNELNQRVDLKDKILIPFYQSYDCPTFCTSRIVGYGGFLDKFKEVEIIPFTQKQTEIYIEIWFENATATNVIKNNRASASNLINELKIKPQIQGLAQNPLLLSLICSLACNTKDTKENNKLELPASRTQVYKKAFDMMLNKWGINNQRASLASDEDEPFKKIEQENLLRYIAYHFSCQREEVFSKTKLLNIILEFSRIDKLSSDRCNQIFNEITKEHGIIQQLSDSSDRYLFLHRTFQEYLTASYLDEKIKESQEKGIALIKLHLWHFDWHETISLIAGVMDDPILLIEAINQEQDDIFNTLLLLTGSNIEHPLIAKTIDRICEFWQSYPAASFIETTLTALGENGNEEVLKRLFKALDKSDDWIIKKNAAKILGKIGNPQAVEALIKALDDPNDWQKNEVLIALGKIGSPQAVEVLIKVANSSSDVPFMSLRSEALKALGNIGNLQAIEGLIKVSEHPDREVRESAVYHVSQIRNPQAVEPLIKAIENSNWLRISAAEALGHIDNQRAGKALIKALEHCDGIGRRSAVEALGRIGNCQAVEALIKALDDSDIWVRCSAVEALGEIGYPQAVEALIKAIDNSDIWVRHSAVEALGKIGNSQAIEALAKALDNSDIAVRCSTAKSLDKIGNSQAVETLTKALKHLDYSTTFHIPKTLGKIGNSLAVEALIKALDHSGSAGSDFLDCTLMCSAADVLGEIRNSQAVEALIKALNHSTYAPHDSYLRAEFKCSIAEALVKSSSALVVEALNNTMEHPDDVVRISVADALGKIGNPSAVEGLVKAIDDPNYQVQINAVKALIQSIEHPNNVVKASAADALGEIGSPSTIAALIKAIDFSTTEFYEVKWNIRRAAALALWQISDPQGVEILIQTLDDPDNIIRRSGVKLLGRLVNVDNQQGIVALIKALNDPDNIVKLSAAEALGEIGNLQAIEELVKALDDPDYHCQINAVEVLGKIGNLQAIEGLIKALNHPNDSIRYEAIKILEQISSTEIVIKIIKNPSIDIYRSDIFLLTRKLTVRHNQKLTHPLIRLVH
jgi:HEAT repeat protein